MKWKQKRLAHILLERADKIAYYQIRRIYYIASASVSVRSHHTCNTHAYMHISSHMHTPCRHTARQAASTLTSCIVDKMDGTKNKCPSFVRPPKGTEEALKDVLKFHVVGIIFHCRPADKLHFFHACPRVDTIITELVSILILIVAISIQICSVSLTQVCPHLSGNSNLNIECLLRALHVEFKEHGMLPVLHVQVCNAHTPAHVPACISRPCTRPHMHARVC